MLALGEALRVSKLRPVYNNLFSIPRLTCHHASPCNVQGGAGSFRKVFRLTKWCVFY